MATIVLKGGPKGGSKDKWYRDGVNTLEKILKKAFHEFAYEFVLFGVHSLKASSASKGIRLKRVDS